MAEMHARLVLYAWKVERLFSPQPSAIIEPGSGFTEVGVERNMRMYRLARNLTQRAERWNDTSRVSTNQPRRHNAMLSLLYSTIP